MLKCREKCLGRAADVLRWTQARRGNEQSEEELLNNKRLLLDLIGASRKAQDIRHRHQTAMQLDQDKKE